MKYRIIEKDHFFYVQEKFLFWWFTWKGTSTGYDYGPMPYVSLSTAEKAIESAREAKRKTRLPARVVKVYTK